MIESGVLKLANVARALGVDYIAIRRIEKAVREAEMVWLCCGKKLVRENLANEFGGVDPKGMASTDVPVGSATLRQRRSPAPRLRRPSNFCARRSNT